MVLLRVDGDLIAVALSNTVRVYSTSDTAQTVAGVVTHGPLPSGDETPTTVVRDVDIDASTQRVATAADDKLARVWTLAPAATSDSVSAAAPSAAATELLSQGFPKKLSAVRLVRGTGGDECRVVVGDRQGAVLTVGSTTKVVQPLLGHTASLITGLAFGGPSAAPLLLSADRDEKVRVSRFPTTFEVEGYCLGHGKFVSELTTGAFPEGVATGDATGTRFLTITGCGDGKIRLYDVPSCRLLATVDVANDESCPITSVSYCAKTGLVVSTIEGGRCVFVHRLHISNSDGDSALLDVDVEGLVPLVFSPLAAPAAPAEKALPPLLAQFCPGGTGLFVLDAASLGAGNKSPLRLFVPTKPGDDSAAGFVLRPAGEKSNAIDAINADLSATVGADSPLLGTLLASRLVLNMSFLYFGFCSSTRCLGVAVACCRSIARVARSDDGADALCKSRSDRPGRTG
eukprot:INCI12866.4.p1 GENE.INCI12866.4~~INCI12866.4.p1  ORF type:complete len:458 (-),score=78.92 INCI12866.4:350-1723(-)